MSSPLGMFEDGFERKLLCETHVYLSGWSSRDGFIIPSSLVPCQSVTNVCNM